MNKYHVGAHIRVTGRFLDINGALVDPSEAHFHIICPDRTIEDLVYGVNPEVKKESPGVYYMDILGEYGVYVCKIYSTVGVIASSDEDEFFVE